ncbi:MAG: EAL domain-containing protein [Solirubrobacteraceae bacterium]
MTDTEELLGSAFDNAPIGMSIVGPDGAWLRINDEYCRMLGYEREELLAGTFLDITHPDDVAADHAFLVAASAGERDSLDHEKRYRHKDGSLVWMHVRTEVTRDAAGAVRYSVSHLQDVSQRRADQARLRESERTLRSVLDNTPAVVYVKGRDQRYKLVNPGFEELFGATAESVVGRMDDDFLPAEVAAELRTRDTVVLEGGVPLQGEELISSGDRERVFLTVRFPIFDEAGQISGVCCMSTDVTDRRRAEARRQESLQCSELILGALAQDRFVLHAQPIVNLATMAVDQAELLIRMRTEREGGELVAPGHFLPGAERFGLIDLIDEWVVGRAVELARSGQVVEVNLSAMTISDPANVDRVERAVQESGAPPGNLIFEITETAMADNIEAAREFAQRLREIGCAFALDDFGVGHGTFTYLRHLPVDYLKIDLQFVRDLSNDVSSQHVVQAIIGVARQFGIKTVAEGVEDEATLDELRRMGADYAQGYFLGRPAPMEDLPAAPTKRGSAYA